MFQDRHSANLGKARALRKGMTPEERKLWYEFLRTLPIRFRRQEVIGPYIADFYCSGKKLIVEVDGSQHYDESGEAYDAERTRYLNSKGLRVIRFSNSEVDQAFESVCTSILVAVGLPV